MKHHDLSLLTNWLPYILGSFLQSYYFLSYFLSSPIINSQFGTLKLNISGIFKINFSISGLGLRNCEAAFCMS